MPYGFTGKILRVDLTVATVEVQQFDADLYRTYMGGTALGAHFLLSETAGRVNALGPENILTIAPGATTGAAVSGVSRCGIIAVSPETGAIADSQVGGSIGPMLKRAGYDAVVIAGKAPRLSMLVISDDTATIRDAEHLRGTSVLEAHDALTQAMPGGKPSILQCGPAGERLVRYACLMADLNDAAGRTGLGAVFGSKNLRAMVVQSSAEPEFADGQRLRELARAVPDRIREPGFGNTLHKYGTPGVLGAQAESGNLPSHNFSASLHQGYSPLDGATFEPQIGAGQTTCFGCVIACRKKVKAETPYTVTERLGGPEFETLALLGSNLGITDPVAVAKANELCNNYGLDTIAVGGLAAYLCDAQENGLISPAAVDGHTMRFGDADEVLWLIEAVARREGVGDVLAEGFAAAIRHFGSDTAALAVQVKNHGLPAHMPRVKPSLALMYAVCPLGADHMSSEHDWLLASASEACRGLGITGQGDASSTGLAKVRMTAYSQYYYSLLDSLCLCMFCWGPDSLFSFRELEDLIHATTGWQCTLWELMKVGERRVNMMRQVNARQGFTREHDALPKRLEHPLPDGPAAGRRITPETLTSMLDLYYAVMGWDAETGNPTRAKLLELGLEWTL